MNKDRIENITLAKTNYEKALRAENLEHLLFDNIRPYSLNLVVGMYVSKYNEAEDVLSFDFKCNKDGTDFEYSIEQTNDIIYEK